MNKNSIQNTLFLMVSYFVFSIAAAGAKNKAECMNSPQVIQQAKQKGLILDEEAQSIFVHEFCAIPRAAPGRVSEISETALSSWFVLDRGSIVNGPRAEKIVREWRKKIVSDLLPEATRREILAKKNNPEFSRVVDTMAQDISKNAVHMAAQGMSLNDIAGYSEAYREAVLAKVGDFSSYKSFKNSLDKVIINLKFRSNPAGASVELKSDRTVLGSTEFSKRLDSENDYTFVFRLDGYEPLEKSIYIPPVPNEQTVDVELKKEKK